MNGDLFTSDFLQKQEFVAFDTETTGMWAASHKLVELSAIKFSLAKGKISVFDRLINPGRKIPEDVIEIHGITDEMVQNASYASEVLSEFIAFCGSDTILVAHNAPFDISFVACELSRNKLKFGDNPVMDTVDIFKRLYPDLSSYSLMNLCKNFKVEQSQRHRALSDAEDVKKLFLTAINKFQDINNVEALKNSFQVYRMNDVIVESAELPPEFSNLKSAVENNSRVEIVYQHPSQGDYSRVINPSAIHKLGSIYYIVGYCELVKEERTFRLDRIKNFKILAD